MSEHARRVGIGWVLQPDDEHLALTAPLLDRVDYLEIAPETTWTIDRRGGLHPNGFAARFLAVKRERGLPVVAHSTALSMAASPRGDEARRAAWLDRVAADHERFELGWWTDHLGATTLPSAAGPRYVALPVPVPASDETLEHLDACLTAMARVVPDVGFENTAFTSVRAYKSGPKPSKAWHKHTHMMRPGEQCGQSGCGSALTAVTRAEYGQAAGEPTTDGKATEMRTLSPSMRLSE